MIYGWKLEKWFEMNGEDLVSPKILKMELDIDKVFLLFEKCWFYYFFLLFKWLICLTNGKKIETYK